MIEAVIVEEGTVLNAMSSHAQKQAVFLEREGGQCKREHLGNIRCNQGPAWQ